MPEIYTRTGDKGLTGLYGGSRVAKQDPAVEAYGTVDEANSSIGEAKAACSDPTLRDTLHSIQQRLFVLAAELASDAKGQAVLGNTIDSSDVTDLEALIDMCLEVTGPQRTFVVPGRDPLSAALHQARTVVRRAERRILTASEFRPVRPEVIKYVNRLSDALYAFARLVEHRVTIARVESVVRDAVARVLGGQVSTDGDTGELLRFDLATAKLMAEAAEAKATEIGVPIIFSAVDAGGNLVLVHRMADSLLGSIDISINKAFTSAAFKLPTSALKDPSTPTGELHGIQNSNDGRVVVFGGGLPVFVGGRIAGGVGVSGGTVDEDVLIVQHAMSIAREATCP